MYVCVCSLRCMSEGMFIYVSTGVCTILCLCVCCACMPRYVCVFMCMSEDRFLCVWAWVCVSHHVCVEVRVQDWVLVLLLWDRSLLHCSSLQTPSSLAFEFPHPISQRVLCLHMQVTTLSCAWVPEIQTCIHKPAKQGLHGTIFPAPFLYINGSRQFGARMAVSTSEQVLFCLPALREMARVKPEKESPQTVHSRVLLSLCRTFRPAAVETQCLGTQMPIITHCHAHEALLSLGQSFCRKTIGLSLSLSPSVTTL